MSRNLMGDWLAAARSTTFHVDDVVCLKASPKALLCTVGNGLWLSGQWIPKSQISEDSEVTQPGERGTLIVYEWFATKKGWDKGPAQLNFDDHVAADFEEDLGKDFDL